jgi:hypothetical protein
MSSSLSITSLRGVVNAMAKSINDQTNKLISSNRVTMDRDFFFYHQTLYYSLLIKRIILKTI